MKISYNLTGAKRKELVTAIAKELNLQAKYCGAPTFAYEIGDLHIDKDGTVTGPDDRGLIADLDGVYGMKAVEAAFDQEKQTTALIEIPTQAEEEQAQPEEEQEQPEEELLPEETQTDEPQHEETPAEPQPEEEAPEEEERLELTISLPRAGLTDDSLERLKRIINSKGSLIKKALGLTELPIDEDGEAVSFPWFTANPIDSDVIKAYTVFVSKMAAMARSLKRVNRTDELPVENEKYAFRCFLLRIGMIGTEFKNERRILMKNFTGSGAFKSGERHAAAEQADTDETEATSTDETEATSNEEQEAAENE